MIKELVPKNLLIYSGVMSMLKNQIILGSHVSMKAPDYFLGSVQEAIQYDANALMIYTGPPQNTLRKDVKFLKIPEAKKL